jgi:hypothetical protein
MLHKVLNSYRTKIDVVLWHNNAYFPPVTKKAQDIGCAPATCQPVILPLAALAATPVKCSLNRQAGDEKDQAWGSHLWLDLHRRLPTNPHLSLGCLTLLPLLLASGVLKGKQGMRKIRLGAFVTWLAFLEGFQGWLIVQYTCSCSWSNLVAE